MAKKEILKGIYKERDRMYKILEYTMFGETQLNEQEPGEEGAPEGEEMPGMEGMPGGEEAPGMESPDMGMPADIDNEEESIADMDTEPLGGTDDAMGGEDLISSEDGEIEIDMTDVIQSTKDTADNVQQASNKIDSLMSTISDLENKLSQMDNIVAKIDDLEQEIERRNPTPLEKLEMRSLSSYPYNVPLSKYWEDKEETSNYRTGDEDEEREYSLGDEDIMSDYDEGFVRNSFSTSYDEDEM